MPDKIWDCGCIDGDDWELLLDGINSELRHNERVIERRKKLVELDRPGSVILLNSAQTDMKKLLDVQDKIESMTLCEME